MLQAGGVVELLAGVAEDEIDGCVGFGNQFAKAVVGADRKSVVRERVSVLV